MSSPTFPLNFKVRVGYGGSNYSHTLAAFSSMSDAYDFAGLVADNRGPDVATVQIKRFGKIIHEINCATRAEGKRLASGVGR